MTDERIRPLNDKVLLLFPDDEVANEGGVLVRAPSVTRMDAKVVGVGPLVPGDIRVGDTVVVDPEFRGMPCDYEGVRYREVAAENVVAVLG